MEHASNGTRNFRMSTTPFRAAFWALGLSLAMTLLLFVPNPRTLRLALHEHRHSPHLPYEQTLIASLESENAKEDQSESGSSSSTETGTETGIGSEPIRVASANPAASLGYHPALQNSEKTNTSVRVQSETSMDSDADPAINILVPEPMHHNAVASNKTDTSKPALQKLAAVPEEDAFAPPFPAESSNSEENEKRVELSQDPTISIFAGTHPKQWSFRFRDASLEAVLKVLGSYQGNSVIVDEELQGKYTAEFPDADPAQVFAVVVKTFHCSVKRRGNYLMLAPRSPEAHR